jgi:hypothetical protein
MNLSNAWGYACANDGNGGYNVTLRINGAHIGVQDASTEVLLESLPPMRAVAVVTWWLRIGMYMTESHAAEFITGFKYAMENLEQQDIAIQIEQDDDDE